MALTGGCHCGRNRFEVDGSWEGQTRVICVNARLLDDFEAADWPVRVLDGKRLW
jgi:hypothetical protein